MYGLKGTVSRLKGIVSWPKVDFVIFKDSLESVLLTRPLIDIIYIYIYVGGGGSYAFGLLIYESDTMFRACVICLGCLGSVY